MTRLLAYRKVLSTQRRPRNPSTALNPVVNRLNDSVTRLVTTELSKTTATIWAFRPDAQRYFILFSSSVNWRQIRFFPFANLPTCLCHNLIIANSLWRRKLADIDCP